MKRKNLTQSYYFVTIMVTIGMFLFMNLMVLGTFLSIKDKNFATISIIVFNAVGVIVLIPFLILYIHYRNAELVNIQVTRFRSLEFGYLRGHAALVGTARVDGKEVTIITTHTFMCSPLSGFCASDYLDKDVIVGYDPKWGKWVVIKE